MSVVKMFRGASFGIYALFGIIAVATSALCVHTVDKQLTSEYEENGTQIAAVIASSSEDVLLNRDLSTLQALIDQYMTIRAIKYVYLVDEKGEMLVHTFVPEVPSAIRHSDMTRTLTVRRNLAGIGAVMEVGAPILGGLAGSVHLGMDSSMVGLKIKAAVGQQIYLISIIFILSIALSALLLRRAARPLQDLEQCIVNLRKAPSPEQAESTNQLATLASRRDEIGALARAAWALVHKSNGSDERSPSEQG